MEAFEKLCCFWMRSKKYVFVAWEKCQESFLDIEEEVLIICMRYSQNGIVLLKFHSWNSGSVDNWKLTESILRPWWLQHWLYEAFARIRVMKMKNTSFLCVLFRFIPRSRERGRLNIFLGRIKPRKKKERKGKGIKF